jgi:hypothetical protein
MNRREHAEELRRQWAEDEHEGTPQEVAQWILSRLRDFLPEEPGVWEYTFAKGYWSGEYRVEDRLILKRTGAVPVKRNWYGRKHYPEDTYYAQDVYWDPSDVDSLLLGLEKAASQINMRRIAYALTKENVTS